MTVTLLEGDSYVITKTQIPKNGTAILLDVGHTDLTKPAYTDKIKVRPCYAIHMEHILSYPITQPA